MASRALTVTITGDPSNFNRALKRIDSSVDHSEGKMKKLGKAGAFALGGLGAVAAAGAVGLKKSADAAIEAEKSQAKMVTQLKAAGVSYKDHAKHIDDVIQKHSKLSGLDDEDLQDSFTNIVRVTGDVNKSLKLTGLAADFARAKHMDVAKAGELVGKVAGGNTGILGRYGIQVEKGATAQEALAKLQEKFSGQAEAYGKTTAGALDRAGVAGENLGEVVGAKLTPLIAKGADVLVDLVDKSGQLAGPIRKVSGVVKDAFDTIQGAFGGGNKEATKFGDNVRDIVTRVVTVAKRMGRNIAETFEGITGDLKIIGRAWLKFQGVVLDVVLWIAKRTLPIIENAIEGLAKVVRGVVKIIAGLLSGDFSKAWDGVRLIVKGAVQAIRGILDGLWKIVRDALKLVIDKAPGLAKDVGGAIIRGIKSGLSALWRVVRDAVVSGVKKGANAAKDAVIGTAESIGNWIIPLGDPLGDGIGKTVGDGLGKVGMSMGAPGLGGGALQGADPDLAPFAGIGSRFGLGVSSGLRVGSITSSGNQSYHATGDAIDESGPAAGMLGYFRFLKKNFGSRLRELIYTPGGVGIKDGKPYRYTGKVAADHYDHVHVAYTGPFGDGEGNGGGQRAIIQAAAKAAGIDPSILWGLYGAESNFGRNKNTSSAGAQGPFQFMPATAKSMGVNPYDFRSAAFGAARYLARYKGRGVAGMLAAYNAGPAGNPNNPETSAYVPKVLSLAKTWGGSSGGAPGASGGGGGAAGNARDAFRDTQKEGRGAAREAVGEARGAFREEREAAQGLPGARLGVRRAKAEARDDLSGLVKVLVDERALKRKRLKLINRVLKGRLSKKRRLRLLEEKAQLVAEIGELDESITEYKADQAGGATTISRADELDAGVDTSAGDASGGGDTGGGAATTEPDPMIAQLAALVAEQVANQQRIIALTQQQGPQIMAAIVAAISGDIGGRVGLGYQTPGYAGANARY